MKNYKLLVGILAGLAISVASSNAIVLNFDALTNSTISFSGTGTFSFTSTSQYQFDITSVSGGVGDSVGLDGYFGTMGGLFTIGTITTNGAEEQAPVSGTSMLHITDINSVDLTATVDWESITTSGIAGILNLNGMVNLSDIEYSGSNSDLQALQTSGMGIAGITFQFIPAESLSELATSGSELSTSYSGSITPVPEPPSSVLVLGGLAALYCLFRFRRAAS